MKALTVTLGVLAAVFLAALVIFLAAAPPDPAARWPGWHWQWMWGWGPFMMLFMVLFWALLFGLVALGGVWLFRRAGSESSNAMRILQERYARGEIGREEYERMRADLLRDRSG